LAFSLLEKFTFTFSALSLALTPLTLLTSLSGDIIGRWLNREISFDLRQPDGYLSILHLYRLQHTMPAVWSS